MIFSPPLRPASRAGLLLALSAALALPGCALFHHSAPADHPVQPADFVRPAASRPPTQPLIAATPAQTAPATPRLDPEVNRVLGGLPRPTITSNPLPTTLSSSPQDLPVDAMVGQVNGQAIYASTVLDPIKTQLQRLGRTLDPTTFRYQARQLVTSTLDEIVFNRLILGEAQRDLSDDERRGLQYLLQQRREDLIRKWGAGSLIVAQMTLREKKDTTIQQMLDEMRTQLVIQHYLSRKLLPKINVTRKDIERYYYDHLSEYQPKPGRTVYLIRTENPRTADEIDARLKTGTPFTKVAATSLNTFHPDQDGLFATDATGHEIIGIKSLNDAALSLAAGAHSPRITYRGVCYWVYISAISTGHQQSLRDAQLNIERTLREQAYRRLMSRYRDQLYAQGSYNPLNQMAHALTDIAVARYSSLN